MTNREQPRAILAWLAVGGWMALITILSGEGFSEDSTSRFIGPLLDWLFPDASPEAIGTLHDAVRKTAHAVEYATLAILASQAIQWSVASRPRGHATLAMTLVLAVAVADETYQSMLPGRDGRFWDTALDGLGGATGVGLFFAYQRTRRIRKGERSPAPRPGSH